jgi:hypothetical protein
VTLNSKCPLPKYLSTDGTFESLKLSETHSTVSVTTVLSATADVCSGLVRHQACTVRCTTPMSPLVLTVCCLGVIVLGSTQIEAFRCVLHVCVPPLHSVDARNIKPILRYTVGKR